LHLDVDLVAAEDLDEAVWFSLFDAIPIPAQAGVRLFSRVVVGSAQWTSHVRTRLEDLQALDVVVLAREG